MERGVSSIEEGVEQPAGVPSGLYLVVMEWMVTITGDRVGYPGFLGFREFFSEEKNLGGPSSAWRKQKLLHISLCNIHFNKTRAIIVGTKQSRQA